MTITMNDEEVRVILKDYIEAKYKHQINVEETYLIIDEDSAVFNYAEFELKDD